MKPLNRRITYIGHPEVTWVVEKSGIRLMRRDSGISELILYPEAMLWDLLSRNKPYERLVTIIAAVAGLKKEAAEHCIWKKVGDWYREGWLVEKADDG